MKIDDAGRERAAAAFRKAVGGKSPEVIAARADIPDATTVRNFIDGQRWPRSKTREKLEDFAGMARGELEAIARGDVTPADEDPVVEAINRSPLGRAAKHYLIAAYYEKLDEQRREATG